MIRRTFSLACLGLAFLSHAANAQPSAASSNYPTKPVRMIIPFPPGGGTDILSRLVASKLSEFAHWSVVPDNRAGAGGTIGLAEAARAAPTGYDIVMGQKDNMVVAPWLYKHLSYDAAKDFTAVAHVAYTPVVIVTRTGSRFKTLADVVAAARSAPDAVTYGSPGNGTTIHLAAELFAKAAGIQLRHVPYKGSNAAMMDALSGNVDLMVSSVPSAMGQIQSGKLRALAVTSARRSTALPEVPTIAESGYKDFDVSTWYGLFVPAATPKEIVVRLNTEVNRLLARPEIQSAIHAQGAEPLAMTSEQFAQLFKGDYEKWRSIVKASGAAID